MKYPDCPPFLLLYLFWRLLHIVLLRRQLRLYALLRWRLVRGGLCRRIGWCRLMWD